MSLTLNTLPYSPPCYLNIYLFIYLWVFRLHVTCIQCPWWSKEGIGFTWDIIDDFSAMMWVLGMEPGFYIDLASIVKNNRTKDWLGDLLAVSSPYFLGYRLE